MRVVRDNDATAWRTATEPHCRTAMRTRTQVKLGAISYATATIKEPVWAASPLAGTARHGF